MQRKAFRYRSGVQSLSLASLRIQLVACPAAKQSRLTGAGKHDVLAVQSARGNQIPRAADDGFATKASKDRRWAGATNKADGSGATLNDG